MNLPDAAYQNPGFWPEDRKQEYLTLRLEGLDEEQAIRKSDGAGRPELVGSRRTLAWDQMKSSRHPRTGELRDTPHHRLFSHPGITDAEMVTAKRVRNAVEQLSPAQKEIVEMFYLDNDRPKQTDLADELGITVSAVERRITKARKQLRELLEAA